MQHQQHHFQNAQAPLQYPTRQDSQAYRPLNANVHTPYQQQQQQQQEQGQPNARNFYGMTEEQFEEMEDRRRMQQLILREKLEQAGSNRNPDPSMTVEATTGAGFALGAFDMSESLAIVEDLLDYFGEEDIVNNDYEGAESQLIEAEKIHLQRESLVRHLYDSEEDYLRSLRDIQSCYQKPFLLSLQGSESKKTGLLGSSIKPVATKEEIETLFGNLEQLLELHEDMRSLLEQRSKIWGPTQIMSDLFISVIPRFNIYSKYFSNFHASLTVLDRISRTVPYKKFMEQCTIDNPPGTASLHLMLAFPLRRLSIYREIINAICFATQPCHPDYLNLIRSLDMMNTVYSELKNGRDRAQDQLTLYDIQSSMVSLPEPIMIPARRLILRADLHKVDSSLTLEPRSYFLMNDVLLYARFDPKKNVYTFKGMFDLATMQVNNPEENLTLPQLPNCVQVSSSGRRQMMRCRSREERDHWMDTMRRVVEIINSHLEDPTKALDELPLRQYATSIASDSSSSLGQTTGMTSSSISSLGKTFQDSRSINSKSSNESTTGTTGTNKTRKPNGQADFYGCSFEHVTTNEDTYKASPLALSKAISNNSSSSTISTGAASGTTTTTTGSNPQSLGAKLAAIPESELTPKQAKAKAALAAAVEARRQERLKKEMKNGGPAVKSDMNKNVNLDFSSSFIPAKERIAKSSS
ncbi:hypothetical protein BGZ49_009928 [Haplosporangium sp. Z 27]|nr:hypothetical protein BGZ49_009928 [Haplosporangium sp. Z 27]